MIQIQQRHGVRTFRMGRTLWAGKAWYFTAAHWVDGLLVDSGCAGAVAELLVALEGCPVHTVVNTHSHEDHIAGNAALQQRHGARLLAHQRALPVLAAPQELDPQQLYRRIFWGYPRPSRGQPVGSVVETEHHRFQVILTPGHSPDHIALYEPRQGWLFTGDAFIGGRDRALKASCNIWQIITSLERLARLDSSLLFAGSGTVHEKPAAVLRRKVDYLRERGRQVLQLHRRGWSEQRIRRRVFGREPLIAYLTQGDFGGLALVRSFIQDCEATGGAA